MHTRPGRRCTQYGDLQRLEVRSPAWLRGYNLNVRRHGLSSPKAREFATGRTLRFDRGFANDRNRRNSVIAARFCQGTLTSGYGRDDFIRIGVQAGPTVEFLAPVWGQIAPARKWWRNCERGRTQAK